MLYRKNKIVMHMTAHGSTEKKSSISLKSKVNDSEIHYIRWLAKHFVAQQSLGSLATVC
jgi:hypothetical protein